MSDPFLKIPEPSLPEQNLLRAAGTLPQLTLGLRQRVVLNVHQQVRYGRWVDRARVAGSVVAACLLVLLVWSFRWTNRQNPQTTEQLQDTVQHDAPIIYPDYISPGRNSEGGDARPKTDANGNPLPEGGPSIRRESIPEMRELNQMIEKLQSRQNVLCGFLPYL